MSGSLARTVFDDGVLLLGDADRVVELEERLSTDETSDRSPRERFDDAIRRIDEHLA